MHPSAQELPVGGAEMLVRPRCLLARGVVEGRVALVHIDEVPHRLRCSEGGGQDQGGDDRRSGAARQALTSYLGHGLEPRVMGEA